MGIHAFVLATDPLTRGHFAPAWAALAGRPVCAWALDALVAPPEIEIVTLVVSQQRRRQAEALVAANGWPRVVVRTIAPEVATLSAQLRGLWDDEQVAAAAAGEAGRVVLHEGARPVVAPELLRALLDQAGAHHIVAAAIPMKETVKWADAAGMVRATPPRAALWQVITPLVLPRAALSALLARDTDERAASTATVGFSVARWVAEGTTYPIHVVRAGHDELIVRQRGDLAVLAEQTRR